MRNLYGTRSIVPNNYSFTFDKIYYTEVPTTQNDGILIGRSVLYHPDKTVYIKTADGYKQIAKLDNTERLIRNEGMVLLPEHNVSSINYLSGDCATYNGDGLYVLNYEDLKTESSGATENGSYKKVSTNSVYNANIIYFTKNDQKQYVQTICRNNYKTIEKENDSIYCNYFVTGSDNNYLYPLYVLEDNSFQNISQNNLFYKNKDVKDCGFIPDFTGKTFIYLKELKLMKESDSGTYYLTTDPNQTEKHTVSHNNAYYYYEEQKNVYKKVSADDLEDKTDYYINNNSFSLVSSAPEGTEIETKYEQYIYYLYQTTDNGATRIQGYFIYPTEEGQDSPYVLINNNNNYVNNRNEGILYFLSKDDENNLDSWPSIRGIPKEDYLKNSVFLLEQRSNKIIEEDEIAPQEAAITIYDDQSKLPNNVPNLYCYTIDNTDNKITIKEKVLISNTAENWHLAKAAGNKRMGVPNKLNVEMYQILTDITMCTNTDGKIIKGKLDKDTDRKELYHNNKTFIRKGKRVYISSEDGQGAIDEDTSKVFYKYDPADRHGLIEVPKNSNLSDTSIYFIDKTSSSWGEWEDITEQYTGYIGDLDPSTAGFISPEDKYVYARLPYNKHTQYYTDDQGENIATIDQVTFDDSCDSNGVSSTYYVKAKANRGNLNNSNTLVEAINTLDEIIGSKTRLDGTQVNQIAQGSLSTTLADDCRPYNIPEDDIMDTLVHHDADIGAIESLSNEKNTYNLTFTKQNEPDDNINSSNKNTVNVRSLTDSTIKTDNMIGYINRLGKDGYVNTNGHSTKGITGTGREDDARPYDIPETNIIDTIVHHDADIGAIEDLKARQGSDNNTNNLNFTTVKDPTDTDELKGVNDIQSIKDALIILDNLIGARRRLKDTTLATKDATLIDQLTGDVRPVKIPENNIIDSIIHHDADIGKIEGISNGEGQPNKNLQFTKIEKQDNNHEIHSLTDAITILDNIIGNYDGIEKEDNSNLKEKNADLVTAINHLSKSIVGYKSGLNDDKNLINDRDTLVTAINALDNILGNFELKENLNASEEKTFISAIQKLDEVLGKFELIQNSNTPNVTTFIDVIKGLDTILGKFDKIGTNNLNLENITTFIDAIKQLDKIIGNASGWGSDENIISAINKINTKLKELHVDDIMVYIKNLAENVDVLDVTINNMMNEQSLMEWGTF